MTVFTAEHEPGTEGKPLVAFMSALFAGGWIWDRPYAALVERGWPVLRTNEPICALDSKVAGSIERLGDALLESCDAVGAEKLVVCANSLGGLVAIDLAGRHPDRIAAIVVSGAPGLTPDPDVGLNIDRRADVRPSGPQFQARMLAALFHGEPLFTQEQIESVGTVLQQGPAMVAMARSIRATRTYKVDPAMDKVTCPSLYVWGRHDRMTPIDPWLETVPRHSGTEFITVEDCGHIPMIEAAEEYNEHLLRFLDRV